MNTTNAMTLFNGISRNGRMKAVLYVLIVAVLVLIVEIFIWSTAKLENAALHDDVISWRNRLSRQAQLYTLNAHLQQTLPLVASTERRYASTDSQSDVMKQLSDLVRNNSLRLHSQSVSTMKNEDGNSSISTIEMRISGRYADIRRVLGRLPTMSSWVEVAEVKLERIDDTSSVNAQFKLLVIKELSR